MKNDGSAGRRVPTEAGVTCNLSGDPDGEVLALKNKYIFINIYIKNLPQSHSGPDRIFLLNCAKRIIEVV